MIPSLLAVALALFATLALGEPLQPEQVYQVVEGPGRITVLAPGVTLADQRVLAVLSSLQLEACAAACRLEPRCAAFEHCDVQDGCARAQPIMQYLDCRLMASNCSVLPAVDKAGQWIRRGAGFPLRQQPLELRDYTTRPAEVLEGGDFICPGTVIPDRCAFEDVLDAISICSSMTTCRSVVHYHNGTSGCSDPVAVLTTAWPTDNNSYVAPTVDVLSKNADTPAPMLLMETDGTVLLPTDAELAAAANASNPSTAWLGCIIAEGALIDGSVVAVASGVATAEECCRACRANSTCNVWNYCAQPGGCSYNGSSPIGSFAVNLTQGQCELRRQELVDPAAGWPPVLLAKGSEVPLTAGAPLALYGPQLPGYDMLPGRLPFEYGSYDCPESEMPSMHVCVLFKTVQQMAQTCDASAECVAFMIKPLPGPPSPLRIALPKNAVNTSLLGLSPTDLFYVRQSAQGSGSGLSSGAIAGIAVGSCAAAAALAVAAWLALRRRQRRRQQQLLPLGNADGDKENAFTVSSNSGGLANGSAQTTVARTSAAAQPCGDAACSAAEGGAACSAAEGGAAGSAAEGGAAGSAAEGGAAGSAAEGGGISVYGATPAGAPPGSLPPLPPMRAGWNARAAPSPFAADASTPFGSSSGGATPLQVGSASGAATPGTGRSRHHGSASRSHSLVQAIPATEAEAAAAAAHAATVAPPTSCGAPGSSSHASSEETLPELVQHVAQCDAVQSVDPAGAAAAVEQHALMSIDSLPPTLRESVVDVSQIRYLTWPNGRLQEIGSGASATVYRALYLNEIVAAKEIDIGRSPAMQEAFVNEAMRLHQLHHPHVVALLGVTIAGSTGILLMEYCAGRDLRSALGLTVADSNERLFGWNRRGRRVVLEVAKALNFLHARGVVHMDVKSNNVLLTSGGTAKLADVGLARLQKGTYLSDVPLIGTFAWIAPEILVGSKQCTSAVDIYSLGVVMWEIITGEQPQRGSLRLPRVPEECPQDIADLMMECLTLEPSERPTAAQVMQRLEGGRSALEAAAVGVPLHRPADGGPHSAPRSQ